MPQRTKYGHDRQRNMKSAPLFLTPQVVRGILGIGHPKRVVTLEVVDIPLADACPPSKICKPVPRKTQVKQASDTLAVDRLDVEPTPFRRGKIKISNADIPSAMEERARKWKRTDG